MKKYLLILLILISCINLFPKNIKYKSIKILPVDDAYKNQSFKEFRNKLIQAVKNRDINFLLNHIDDKIMYSFGADDNNKNGFIKYWNLNNNLKKSDIWSELNEVLKNGGTFDNKQKTSFTAPYTFTKFPSAYDSFSFGIITAENVNIRLKPSSKSKVIDNLSYNIVKFSNANTLNLTKETIKGETHIWKPIITPSGKEGYILGKYIRSPVDYRIRFIYKNNVWKIVFFIAGD